MKRISVLIAVLWVMFILVPSIGLPAGSAQGEKEGIAIFKEARELQKTARAKEDRERALAKYEQALEIFTRVKSDRWEGTTLSDMALISWQLDHYQKALEYGEKALPIQRKTGDETAEAFTLNRVGLAYHGLLQFHKALENYEKALGIHKKFGNLQGEGATLGNMGQSYRNLSQFQKALEYHEKALEIHKKTRNVAGEAVTLGNIGLVYNDLSRYQKALEYLEKALEIHKKTANAAGEGSALSNIGLVYNYWGQYSKSLEFCEKALPIQRKIGDLNGEGYTLNRLGMNCLQQGQYQKAVEYYEKSLQIIKKTGQSAAEGTRLTNIARVYALMGQYQKALEYCDRGMEIQRKVGYLQGEAWCCDLRGDIYHSWGQRQKAIENYQKALEIYAAIGDERGESFGLSRIGGIQVALAKYDDALKHYYKALEITNKIGTPTDSVKALIAGAYMENGELDKAEEVLRGTNSNWALGKLHLLRLEYDQAKDNYEKLLAFAEKSGNVSSLFTAYTGLGKVYEGLEDYEKAKEYYEKGMNLTEEIRSGLLPSERKNFFEVKVNGFQRIEPSKGLTRVKMKLHQAAGSIDSSEVTRARGFSDSIALTTKAGSSGVPNQILQKEDELVSKVAALKKELAKTDKEKQGGRYENLSKEVQDAEKDLKAFVEMLWVKYKTYASVKYPRPVTLKESSLKPEECLVMFDVSGEGVGVTLIKGKKIAETHYKEWKSEDLEKDVRKFREPFEREPFKISQLKEFDPELGESLYKNLLLRVLVDVRKGTPLVIIPDGILAILPFEALVVSGKPTWKEEGGRPFPEGLTYLGDVYPISYYESVTAMSLARTLRSKEKPGAKTLVIADPVFEPDDARLKTASGKDQHKLLAALPDKLMSDIKDQTGITFPRLSKTTEMAETLKKLNPDKTILFTGMQAKKSILFDKLLTDYGYIVFGTHGYFGTDIPGIQEPVLAMTLVDQLKDQDGFVRMTEVMGMKLNADVVALTACKTGLGNNLAGEGVMSMGKAFQYAGAKSILTSLWSVSESGSVLLTEKFFEHLKEGKNKLDALKAAREDVRNGGYKHPFYWASFILVGETD